MGWIKATLVNRVTVKAKPGEGKDVVYDFGVADVRINDDTNFDPEKPSATTSLGLQIPVIPINEMNILTLENLSNCIHFFF